jgi:septum site-determining protein MinC
VFELKSATLNALALLLRSTDLSELEHALQQRYGDKPGFFENEPVVVDLSSLPAGGEPSLQAFSFAAFGAMLLRHGLNPVAVRGGSPEWMAAGVIAGLVAVDMPAAPQRTAQPDTIQDPVSASPEDRAAEAAVAEAIAGLDVLTETMARRAPAPEVLGDIPYTSNEQDEAAALQDLALDVADATTDAAANAGQGEAPGLAEPVVFEPPPAESHYAHLADVALHTPTALAGLPTDTAQTETGEAVVVADPHVGALIIDRSLRTGQQVYARGRDLVVLGAVNFGADVLADGSIHIYGPLRGRAFAGAKGDTTARVFSTRMEPQVVSVAGVWKLMETDLGPELTGKPVQARLDGTEIRFEPIPL